MTATNVTVPDLRDLRRLWPEVGRRIEAGMIQAARSAASWGVAHGTSRAQASGVNASQTYARSFLSMPTRNGAVLSNKAEHSFFVERGRLPGRAPPISVIGQWMVQKGIAKVRVAKSRDTNLTSARGQANRTRASKRRAAAMERYRAIAWQIAMKIARRGTKGRFIFRAMLPALHRRWMSETRRQLSRLTRDPPR